MLPNIDAANIAYNLLKTAAGGGIAIGPVLLGAAKPVHILTASATVRRIVNMSALTVADANATALIGAPQRAPCARLRVAARPLRIHSLTAHCISSVRSQHQLEQSAPILGNDLRFCGRSGNMRV